MNDRARASSNAAAVLRNLTGMRLMITIACFSAAYAIQYIPLPGLTESALNSTQPPVLARLSVGALGVMPWVSAAILVEIAGMVFPPVRRSNLFRQHHVHVFHPFVLTLAFVLGSVQAYGMVGAMESSDVLRSGGDLQTSLLVVASLLGGVAVAVFVAQVIERRGLGHGFWLIAGLGLISEIVRTASMTIGFIQSGAYDALTLSFIIVLPFGVLILGAVYLTGIGLAHGMRDPGFVVWPLAVAMQLGSIAFVTVISLTPLDLLSGPWSRDGLIAAFNIVVLLPILWFSLKRQSALPAFRPIAAVVIGVLLIQPAVSLFFPIGSFALALIYPIAINLGFLMALAMIVPGSMRARPGATT